jgi:hypothetical protein
MKPLTGGQQLRSVSLSYCVALQALNQNPLHEEEGAWMQAPIEISRRGVEEVFSLDILSHRMSVNAFHEKAGRSQGDWFWYLLVTLFLPSRAATVATLPSALFEERFLVRSVQVGCSRFSRCCHLFIDLGSISRMKAGPGD